MIQSSSSSRTFRLLAFVILILFLSSITMIDGNNNNPPDQNQMVKRFPSKNAYHDLLEQAEITPENIAMLLRDLQLRQQQAYADRRLSFHALRGKRQAE